MDKLIQTSEANIIYGEFRGENNQELIRSPLMKDIENFINKERRLVVPFKMNNPFVDQDTTEYIEDNLHKREGYIYKGYFRMYWRYGWYGRWFDNNFDSLSSSKVEITQLDILGVERIVDWFCENFPKGCNWEMDLFFSENYTEEDKNVFYIQPYLSDIYRIAVNTTYGNEDYPVRIYVFEKEV